MTSKFIPSSRKNPCLICGRIKDADCRFREAGNLILCHTLQDAVNEPNTQGYKFLRRSDEAAGYGVWVWQGDKPIKPERPKKKVQTVHYYHHRNGNLFVRVVRTDSEDGKDFRQEHHNGTGFVLGMAEDRASIPIYQYKKVQDAIKQGKPIFWVEGEKVADLLWSIGIAATTSIGGSKAYRNYGNGYKDDLKGATVILMPDRDEAGLDYIKEVAKDFPEAKYCKVFPKSPLWNHIPKNGGLDAADWIAEGATADEIIGAIVNSLLPESKNYRADLEKLIEKDHTESELQGKLIEIGKEYQISPSQLKYLADSIKREQDFESGRESRGSEVSELLSIAESELRLIDFIDPRLADPIAKIADLLNLNQAAYLLTLLAASASLIKPDSCLEIDAAINFYCKAIFWGGIVAPSGSKKSPIHRAIVEPIQLLQAEADQEYLNLLEDYRTRCKEAAKNDKEPPPEPKPREYVLSDITLEGIARVIQDRPGDGVLMEAEELSMILRSPGQYKRGSGNDTERLLQLRDGRGIKVNRANGQRISVPKTSVSIIGGIQPDVLKNFLGDGRDGNGFFARFIWAYLTVKPSPFPVTSTKTDISELLRGVYRRLESQPRKMYKLSPEGKRIYVDWYNATDSLRVGESHQGLAAVYSKSQGWAGELALILHCLNAAIRLSVPGDQISAETMQAAIAFSRWAIGQAKLIYSEVGACQDDLSSGLRKIVSKFHGQGEVTLKQVGQLWNSKNRPKAEILKRWILDLEQIGFARVIENGRNFKFEITKNQSTSPPEAETFTRYGF